MNNFKNNWYVVMQNGEKIEVPTDKDQTPYENIGMYGISAVIERVKRTPTYKKLVNEGVTLRYVIDPYENTVRHF